MTALEQTTASPAPAIRVAGLQAHYGPHQVLHDVDLEVRPGEIMVVMGGSGSGKSTLLRHLVGLSRPTAGRIELLGTDITRAGAMEMLRLRRKLGVAFQGGALFSSMTVLENIMLPLREHTRLARETMEIMARLKLEVVNLAGADALMPSQLSGGMLKRAAVARAIVMDPKLLFFDEPSAGLDPVVSSALDDLILKDYRVTVDPDSEQVILLSPAGAPHAYYAERGFVGAGGSDMTLPTGDTVWTAEGQGTLTPNSPVTLTYDNGAGLKFMRTISIDDKYMFTVDDKVTNTGPSAVTLYPYGLVSRHELPHGTGRHERGVVSDDASGRLQPHEVPERLQGLPQIHV